MALIILSSQKSEGVWPILKHFKLQLGAQKVALSMCVSVCPCVTFMNSSLNPHASSLNLRAVLEQSQSRFRAVLENSYSILSILRAAHT